jgi:hypothetical protein
MIYYDNCQYEEWNYSDYRLVIIMMVFNTSASYFSEIFFQKIYKVYLMTLWVR